MNKKQRWVFFSIFCVVVLFGLGCNVPGSDNIFEAIASGNTTKVQQYISDGNDINVKDSNQNTLLIYAISNDKNNIVNLLLSTPIDVNERNNQGLSALMVASQKNNITVVDWLTTKDVYVNAKDKGNFSALMFASEMGYPEIVAKLLDKGAKIDEKNLKQETALILAVKNNHLDVTKLLLQHNPQKDYEVLYIAAEKGYSPILEELLNNNYNSKQSLTEALHRACLGTADSPDVIRKLNSLGAEVDTVDLEGNTPLLLATKNQKPEVVKTLISLGANVNYKNLKSNGETPLLLASKGDNLSIVEELIQAGAKVNSNNSNGVSPLMLASQAKNLEIVRKLIDTGSNVNTKDNNGENALIFAIKSNSVEIMQELIKRGAPINSRHKNNETPLMYATRQNNKDLVHALVVLQADIEAKNNKGQTALDIAQKNKYEASERELLNAGAIEHKEDVKTKVKLDPDVFPAGKVPAYIDGSIKQDKKSKVQYENLKLQGNISIDIPTDWKILSADTIEVIKRVAQQNYNVADSSKKQILGVNAVPEGAMIRLSISNNGLSGPMLNMATEQDFKEASREFKRSMNSVSYKTNIRVLDDPKVYATTWKGLTCGIMSYTRSDAQDSNAKWQVVQQHIPFKGKTLTFTTSLKIGVNTEKNYKEILDHVKASLKIN